MKQRTRVICYLLTVLVILDQITKLVFWSHDFFVGPLHVHTVKNYGLAFSLNFGLIPNLIVIGVALGYFIYYFFQRQRYSFFGILVLAGAISNLIDRIYFGFVRDFLDLGLNFTFNLADVFIVLGLAIILLYEQNTNFGD